LKRISQNRDLFEADPGETISVTIQATKTPYQATFSTLESGGQWTAVQSPTPAQPVEVRQFTMPGGSREFFDIVYAFPPPDQTDADAKYSITFSGNGTTDGPNDVLPPVAGDLDDLPYEFRLPGMQPLAVSGLRAKTPMSVPHSLIGNKTKTKKPKPPGGR
jgi:hypothetical protein